ncbi:mammalian cell entry protein [Mycobacterium colombiense]|uniref:mammalian cell entry protein n=1 Tax=Mycobacterium colombiense TaxID=339268 RepID=UPI00096CA7B3|nr:mammalian cell entry protein [Mycobacterium colombiense]OMB89246.1 mammalian cell entry protein [Mycobacterium colombiense]OMC18009.1 mammalian cell entry protein [Mycobacterium colombiense]OMC25383.1 mammalian cell entry protein [Mycobacterium colombiense]
MEDQQPAAGDVTAEESPAAPEADATGVPEGDGAEPRDEKPDATTESDGGDAAESDGADAEAAGEDAEQTAGAAPADGAGKKRRAGKAWAIVAVIAALLFVGSAAFAGAMMQPYLADRATAATKLNVARTAASAITTLWTYTPENMDTLADRASRYLSGDFEAQYRKFVDAIVAPNKQAKISNSTEVTGAAVETLDDPNASVIVYTNTTSTSPLTKNVPSLKYLSYRLFLKRSNNRWLVTRMTTITSLDLTPKV